MDILELTVPELCDFSLFGTGIDNFEFVENFSILLGFMVYNFSFVPMVHGGKV